MHQPTIRQRLLPFADESEPRRRLPQEHRERIQTLLARLILQTVHTEAEERRSHEHREDPSDPS